MVKVRDVFHAVDSFASFSWSCEWDNSGLQTGSLEWEVTRVGVSLDASNRAIEEAINSGCSCLLVHHPLIFYPIRSITPLTLHGVKIIKILENRIAVIAAHTNWDVSPVGVNVILGEAIGLMDPSPLEEIAGGAWGMGLHGCFPGCISPEGFLKTLMDNWGLSWVREYNLPETVSKVALAGGSGGDLWPAALSKGADVFVTADMKYHQVAEAVESGLGIVLVDHGEMERRSIPAMKNLISDILPLEVVLVDPGGFDPGRETISKGR
jgi:dinuclear metal center YbgI/SA1388 family protein